MAGFHGGAERQAQPHQPPGARVAPRRALASRLFKVSVLDQHKFVLADLIAARLVRCVYGLAFEAMACSPVDLPEGDPLHGRACGIERDGTRDEGQLQIALPVGSGCRHRKLQRKKGTVADGQARGVNGRKGQELQGGACSTSLTGMFRWSCGDSSPPLLRPASSRLDAQTSSFNGIRQTRAQGRTAFEPRQTRSIAHQTAL